MTKVTPPLPLALYIHWPYCSRICPYCDFNVTRDRGQTEIQTALYEALMADLEHQATRLGPRHLISVFFGGGTPSLMKPEWIDEILTKAKTLFPPLGPIEITLEANPTDAERSRFQAFKSAGINRLSLGIQSFDDQALAFLGRNHSAKTARQSLETAQALFERMSLDLIYALPDQSLKAWQKQMDEAVSTGAEHISPYQLGIEPQTAFYRAQSRGAFKTPTPEMAAAFYELTQSHLGAKGFEAYEVSNHAKGPKARALHNVNVWRGHDYMGIGPGAHGRLSLKEEANGVTTRYATEALGDIKAYIERVKSVGFGCELSPLSPVEALEERLILGLRMSEGARLEGLERLNLLEKAKALLESGHLHHPSPEVIAATPKGRLVLDHIIGKLLA